MAFLKQQFGFSNDAKKLLKQVLAHDMNEGDKIDILNDSDQIHEILSKLAFVLGNDEAEILGIGLKRFPDGQVYRYCLHCDEHTGNCMCKNISKK